MKNKSLLILIAVFAFVSCSEDESPVDRFAGDWYYESYVNPNFFRFEIKKVGGEYIGVGISQPDFTVVLNGRSESGFESIIVFNSTERHEIAGATFSEDLNLLRIGTLTVTTDKTNQQPVVFTDQALKKLSNRN